MVFHWSLSGSKCPQVSRTRLRILAVLSNAVVWIVSSRPQTSKSSRPFNNPLVIVPNAPITIGTIVTFMFHGFLNSLASSWYLSFFLLSFKFILWSARRAKSTILQIMFFFFLIIMRSGLLGRIWGSVCKLKSNRGLCESFSRTCVGLCIYYLLVWSNWNFLHISQWITLPTQSCLALYSFCANLLHSLIMSLVVSSLSPHSLLYCYYSLIRTFHICNIRWFFTEVWVTTSILKSPGLFLVILAVLNNVVVWMVSTPPPTSKSSSPFSNPLVTVPNALITIGVIFICMFHSFFSSLARSRYLSFFSHSFSFILWSAGTAKSTILQVLFFFVDYY